MSKATFASLGTFTVATTLVVALAMLLIPAIGSVVVWPVEKRASESHNDERIRVAHLPDAIADGYARQFFGQARLAQTAAQLRFALGMEPNDQGVIGRESWLFLASDNLVNQARGADGLSREAWAALTEHLQTKRRFWQQRGVPFVVVIAPSKVSVYREQLPARYPIVGPSRLAEYREALVKAQLPHVDLYAMLQRHRDDATPIYPYTDSHWTCYGAFLAYRSLMETLKSITGQTFISIGGNDVTLQPRNTAGNIAANVFGLRQAVSDQRGVSCSYPTRDSLAWNYDNDQPVAAREPRGAFEQLQSVRFHNRNARNSYRVAVIRDSFFWPVQPLLNLTFSDVLYVYHWQLRPLEHYVARFDPDLVIYEHTDRALYEPVEHWRKHRKFLPPLRSPKVTAKRP